MNDTPSAPAPDATNTPAPDAGAEGSAPDAAPDSTPPAPELPGAETNAPGDTPGDDIANIFEFDGDESALDTVGDELELESEPAGDGSEPDPKTPPEEGAQPPGEKGGEGADAEAAAADGKGQKKQDTDADSEVGKTPPEAAPDASPASSEPQKPLAEQLTENRDAIIDHLAKEKFTLTKEDEDALETDAVAAIPKLLARAHYESMMATLNHINNTVPNMIQQQTALAKQHEAAKKQFFESFPMLDEAQHWNDVEQYARIVKQANPKITRDELFATVGAAVIAKHGLGSGTGIGNGAAQPNGQQAPAAAPTQSQQKPYAPAKPGTSAQVKPEPTSPFDILGMDLDDTG